MRRPYLTPGAPPAGECHENPFACPECRQTFIPLTVIAVAALAFFVIALWARFQ